MPHMHNGVAIADIRQGVTIADVFYPWPISPERQAELGIIYVDDDAPRADDRFYWNGDLSRPKDVALLKAGMVAQAKQTANALLAPSGWMIERSVDPSSGKPVPDDVLAFRAAVRKASNANEALINAAETVEDLAALKLTWPDASQ